MSGAVHPPARSRLAALALFIVSGVLALGVDIGVLYAAKPWLGPYVGRLLSWWCAATFTWAFNRQITFAGAKRHRIGPEYARYLASMAVGGAINYGAYSLTLLLWSRAAAQPAIGVAVGSLVGLGFNFIAASRIMAPPPAAAPVAVTLDPPPAADLPDARRQP